MKKLYIKPTSKSIVLCAEDSILNPTSLNIYKDQEGEIDGGMTNKQESNSLWDNWSD